MYRYFRGAALGSGWCKETARVTHLRTISMPDENVPEATLNTSATLDSREKYDASKIDKLEGL